MSPKTNKHERALVRVLDRDLDPARHLVRALDRDLDLAVVRARDRDRALDLARDLAHALDLAHDRAHALDRDRDLDFALALVPDLARSLDRACDLARSLDRACDLALARAGGLSDQFRDLVQLVEVARQRAHQLVEACGESAAGVAQVRVSGLARWLVERAARVVPVSERARYAEEWRCELWELGQQTRGRRRRQLAHALRLLTRTWGVRDGVRAARRRPAGG